MTMFVLGVLAMSLVASISLFTPMEDDNIQIITRGPVAWALALTGLLVGLGVKIYKHIVYRSILVDPKDQSLWVVPIRYTDALIEVNHWNFPSTEVREMLGGTHISMRYVKPCIWKGYPEALKSTCKRALRIYNSILASEREEGEF